MDWIRSWPARIPAGRSYVVDDLPRFVMDDYDYAGLAAHCQPGASAGVCLIEWDMAATWHDLDTFADAAAHTPDLVRVAPYPLYQPDGRAVWAHRRVRPDGAERWLRTGEPTCEFFAFGMIYLPYAVLAAFAAAPAPARGTLPGVTGYADCRLHDQTLSVWHHYYARRASVCVDWHVRPVHLHDARRHPAGAVVAQ